MIGGRHCCWCIFDTIYNNVWIGFYVCGRRPIKWNRSSVCRCEIIERKREKKDKNVLLLCDRLSEIGANKGPGGGRKINVTFIRIFACQLDFVRLRGKNEYRTDTIGCWISVNL